MQEHQEVMDIATSPDRDGARTGNMAADLIAEGHTVQAMQTAYATAVAIQRPRDIYEVERRCLQEAAMIGEAAFYGWGAGKDRIEGPSVDLAMIAARNWGNCAVPARPMQETPTAYVFTAAFVDLETGFTVERQFRQSKKSKVYGKHDEERKSDIRFQIGMSKATRNVILKGLPQWLIDRMMAEAKAGVRAKIELYISKNSLEAARDLTVKSLAKVGVELERIEEKLGKVRPLWQIEELVILRGDLRAINDGAEAPETLFPFLEDAPIGDGATATEEIKNSLRKNEQAARSSTEATTATADNEQPMRDMILQAAASLSEGDMQKADTLVDVWMQGCGQPPTMTLQKCSGAALRKLYDFSGCEARRAAVKSASKESTEKEGTL